jgi:hypothetical protein
MREAYYYLRDPENRPVITVCLLIDGHRIARGVAICSDRDVPCKKDGRARAKGRAQSILSYAAEREPFPFAAVDFPVRREEALKVLECVKHALAFKAYFNPDLTEFECRFLYSKPVSIAA